MEICSWTALDRRTYVNALSLSQARHMLPLNKNTSVNASVPTTTTKPHRMQRGNYLEGLWRGCHQHSAWIAQVLLPEGEFGGNEKGSCILYRAESLFSEAGPRNTVSIRALSPAFETVVTNVKANFANKGFSGGSVLFSTAGKAAHILEWDLKSRFLFFFLGVADLPRWITDDCCQCFS